MILVSALAVAAPRPVVVELFTSQGCSDCPPADALLGELARRDDVLALAFHVDYWNNLGWKDPFSSADATSRQNGYEPHFRLNYVYTPQMVVDGAHDVVGSERDNVLALLKGMRDGVPLSATRDAQSMVIEIGAPPASLANAIAGDVILVAYSDTAETKVPRGENAGKTLREFNVVRGMWRLGKWKGEAQKLTFDAGKLPEEANMVALLLQAPGQGEILGAAKFSAR